MAVVPARRRGACLQRCCRARGDEHAQLRVPGTKHSDKRRGSHALSDADCMHPEQRARRALHAVRSEALRQALRRRLPGLPRACSGAAEQRERNERRSSLRRRAPRVLLQPAVAHAGSMRASSSGARARAVHAVRRTIRQTKERCKGRDVLANVARLRSLTLPVQLAHSFARPRPHGGPRAALALRLASLRSRQGAHSLATPCLRCRALTRGRPSATRGRRATPSRARLVARLRWRGAGLRTPSPPRCRARLLRRRTSRARRRPQC